MLSARRTVYAVARGTAWGLGGTTAIGAAGITAYSQTESGAGFRREFQFWRGVAPIVADYYLQTAASSPLVRYRRWTAARASASFSGEKDEEFGDREDEEEENCRRREMRERLHEKHAPEMLRIMLDLKGLYVKLGQVLSVTALPIPEQYRVQFRTLQSDVPGWEAFDDVIGPTLEREFGRPLDEVFEFIDPVPCGAASIGQAHRARLISADGDDEEKVERRDVVVKVQYPDAAWQVPADIQCVGDFLKLCVLAGVVDETSARMSYDEFSRQFLAELDYDRECRNLQEVYKSSLDPSAPYHRRHVVIPRVHPELCTNKVITMTYLPGPKLEAEAKRQLAMLGIDTSKGIADVIRDAAKDASNPEEPESGELVKRVTNKLDPKSGGKLARRVTKSIDPPTSSISPGSQNKLKATMMKIVGQVFGVDSILWVARFAQRMLLWSQAAVVASIVAVPRPMVPSALELWAYAHRTAAAQAKGLSLAEAWIDALFDVHGHQIFNLGLFNADPHPGNILVLEKDNGEPSCRLGLIDYGQCKRLTPSEQVQIARLILSVANDKADEEIASAFRDLGIITKNDSTEFLAMFSRLMFGPLKPEHLNHSWHMKLHKMDKVTYFPKELSMVYRTSLLLRGLAISLQMNYSIGNQWKHHAQEAVVRIEGEI